MEKNLNLARNSEEKRKRRRAQEVTKSKNYDRGKRRK